MPEINIISKAMLEGCLLLSSKEDNFSLSVMLIFIGLFRQTTTSDDYLLSHGKGVGHNYDYENKWTLVHSAHSKLRQFSIILTCDVQFGKYCPNQSSPKN